MLLVDPPEGWKYGFPKLYDQKNEESVEAWFLRNGYPQELIDKGCLHYCIFTFYD